VRVVGAPRPAADENRSTCPIAFEVGGQRPGRSHCGEGDSGQRNLWRRAENWPLAVVSGRGRSRGKRARPHKTRCRPADDIQITIASPSPPPHSTLPVSPRRKNTRVGHLRVCGGPQNAGSGGATKLPSGRGATGSPAWAFLGAARGRTVVPGVT